MPEEFKKEQDITKKSTKKIATDGLIEQYQYVPSKDEELIVDKPSEPLNLVEETLVIVQEPIKIIKPVIKTNKELYESYIKELRNFSLSINSEIIYDSSIDKSTISPLKFEKDYFILYGKKYSYNGLKIQKINVR